MNIDCDIASHDWKKQVLDFSPEIVFHLAAQSLVFTGLRNPVETFETNVLGSLRVLELLESNPSIKTMVIITTDKVYKPEFGTSPRVEGDPIGGIDPYSASKGSVELMVHSWPLNSNQSLATARSGNVIGGGDNAEKRLIPDVIRAWRDATPINLRSPDGIRPWLHVLEPLRGYLLLAESGYLRPGTKNQFNFAPSMTNHVSVRTIAERAVEILPRHNNFLIVTSSDNKFPETSELFLNGSKAFRDLDWMPVWDWEKALEMTLRWYVRFYEGSMAESLIQNDIENYTGYQSA